MMKEGKNRPSFGYLFDNGNFTGDDSEPYIYFSEFSWHAGTKRNKAGELVKVVKYCNGKEFAVEAIGKEFVEGLEEGKRHPIEVLMKASGHRIHPSTIQMMSAIRQLCDKELHGTNLYYHMINNHFHDFLSPAAYPKLSLRMMLDKFGAPEPVIAELISGKYDDPFDFESVVHLWDTCPEVMALIDVLRSPFSQEEN